MPGSVCLLVSEARRGFSCSLMGPHLISSANFSGFDLGQRSDFTDRGCCLRYLTEVVMSTNTMLVTIGVVLMFLVCAAVLAWADHQTRRARLEK